MKKLITLGLMICVTCFGQTIIITEPISETDTMVVYPKLVTRAEATADLAALDARLTEASAYGTIYIHDGTNTLNLSTQGVYYAVQPFTANGSSNVTLTASNITITAAGVYDISGALSFQGDNDTDYELAIYTNGVHQNIGEANFTSTAAGLYTSMRVSAQLDLAVGNTVSLRIADLSGTTAALAMNQAILSVTKLTGLKGDKGDTGTISTSTGVIGLTDTYNGTNYLAEIGWDAEFKVLTVTETAE